MAISTPICEGKRWLQVYGYLYFDDYGGSNTKGQLIEEGSLSYKGDVRDRFSLRFSGPDAQGRLTLAPFGLLVCEIFAVFVSLTTYKDQPGRSG